jgi:hypothetical protein
LPIQKRVDVRLGLIAEAIGKVDRVSGVLSIIGESAGDFG